VLIYNFLNGFSLFCSVQEAIPVMCHTVKHINNLVILLRNYRARLNSKSMRNQVMDNHHSAALGAKILTREALAQAELLKVQLHGMLLKLDPVSSSTFLHFPKIIFFP